MPTVPTVATDLDEKGVGNDGKALHRSEPLPSDGETHSTWLGAMPKLFGIFS